jgi:hypothetical protein
MTMIMGNLTGAVLIAAVAFGMGRPQSAAQELRLSDIRAQQPRETIYASAPCQRAKESPRHSIWQSYPIDPKTLVQDLNTLMDVSDDVILAGMLDRAAVISPSGKSLATYEEVRVIRSWKGPHHAGDTLTFGMPLGSVICVPNEEITYDRPEFTAEPGDFGDLGVPTPGPYVYVLFLRQSKGNETQLVQGLRLASGEGVQGIFLIQVPGPTYGSEPEMDCAGVQHWSWQRCDSYMEGSQSPVMVPYAHDPLAKKYNGKPASVFLQEMRSVTAGQRVAEKSSLR